VPLEILSNPIISILLTISDFDNEENINKKTTKQYRKKFIK